MFIYSVPSAFSNVYLQRLFGILERLFIAYTCINILMTYTMYLWLKVKGQIYLG